LTQNDAQGSRYSVLAVERVSGADGPRSGDGSGASSRLDMLGEATGTVALLSRQAISDCRHHPDPDMDDVIEEMPRSREY
jgi:hypothetical protein